MKVIRILLSLTLFLAAAIPLYAISPPATPPQLSSPDQVPEGLAKSDWSSIRAAYEAGRHAFQPVDGGWQARNQGQQWTTKFDRRGFLAQPKDADWQWGLEFKSYGFGEQQTEVGGTPAVRNEGQRLSYQWDDSVQEWFVNDSRGLEHGFTITRRPAADDSISSDRTPLSFTLATRGSLHPTITSDALTVHFRDSSNAPVINYSGLKVWDADGKILTSRFAEAGENQVRLLVEEAGARYPLTIDPIAQQAYLKSSHNGPPTNDYFGISVAVSGDTVVIGSSNEGSSTTGVNSTPNENAPGAGAAYVFVRNGTTWSQQAYLKASNTGTTDQFGASVAVSGNTIVVGAAGEDSSSTGVGSTPNELAGESGAAYVFIRSGVTWSQQAYLKSSNTGTNDGFGSSVSVSSDTVVVGASQEDALGFGANGVPNESATDSGAAYVFFRSGTTWSQQAYLKASNTGYLSQFGTTDLFGCSVAVAEDTIVVGASGEKSNKTGVNSPLGQFDSPSFRAGAAYVFVRSGTTWSQQAYLKASNTTTEHGFGASVAVAGDSIVVGALYAEAAYVFSRSGTTWAQQAFLKASNPGNGDNFGRSVSISSDTVAIGANGEDSSTTDIDSLPNEGGSQAGASYVFVRSGVTWSQQAYLKASNSGQGDFFGVSVAVSGETVIVGAYGEDSNATGVNNLSNELANTSGAAYAFVRTGTVWSQQSYFKASNTPVGPSGAIDLFGYAVAISADTVVVGTPGEDSGTTGVNSTRDGIIGNSGAAFIFIRSGNAWIQQAYLKASSTSGGDSFGTAVAISGDTVVVGANYEDSSTTGINGMPDELASDSGAAYVFVRNGSAWTQQAFLKADNVGTGDEFGSAVAISGDKLVVGAYREDSSTTGIDSNPNELKSDSGAAYVFGRSGSTWNQQAYLKASTNTGNYDNFGRNVAISGDTVAVAGYKGVHIFMSGGGLWSQQANLEASSIGSYSFGRSVAISGNTMIIGAPSEDSFTTNNQLYGAAYVFVRSGPSWSQQARLTASNYGYSDQFGESVAISENSIVVGARYEDSSSSGVNSTWNNSAADSGAAYVFTRNGTTWSETAYLKAQNTGAGDSFGHSVAISGGTVVVGAYREDSGTIGVGSTPDDTAPDSGASYVFSGFEPPATEPIVGSPTLANASNASASLGGDVSGDGGSTVTGRGIVYSVTSANSSPAIGGQDVVQIPASGTTGAFVVLAAGLTPGTNYTFKAYATNSEGTGYSTSSNFSTLQEFLVTFDPGAHGIRTGGGELTQWVIEGTSASAPLITAYSGWLFSGWDMGFDIVSSTLIISAEYEPIIHTVTFDPGTHGSRTGGGALVQDIVQGNPALAPVITANTGWTFSSWDTAFDNITSNLMVTALYAPVTYTVTFVLGTNGTQSGGGALLQTIQHGDPAIAPNVVPNAGWQFTGWSSTFDDVTSDLEITATYVEAPQYTVTFSLGPNGYGTRIGGGELVQSIVQGGSAIAPQISPAFGQRFVGWDQPLSNITGNILITAVYEAYAVWTVTFDLGTKGTLAGGGALVQVIEQGYPAVAPVVSTDADWVFAGWDLPFNSVTSNLTITALYAPANCVVIFDPGTKGARSGGGALSQNVAYSGAAEAPLITASLGWTFVGWDLPFDIITGDTLIRAVY